MDEGLRTDQEQRTKHPGLRFLESLLHAIGDGLQYLDAREVLVVAFDERPRRHACTRSFDHLVDGLRVVAPPAAIAPAIAARRVGRSDENIVFW